MAKYRNVSVKFWSDDFVAEELTPEKRYFFLYLLTNEHTAQCGIYEITKRQMAFESGYNQETVDKLLQFFEERGKIKWSKETNEIAIKNFVKYNPQGSSTVKVFVTKELKEVKNKDLIAYLYPIDPVSKEEEEEEEEEEKNNKNKNNDKAPPSLEQRKKLFGDSLVPFIGKYTKEMIRQFFDYWTEHNEGGKKMRFEMEKVFNTSRRLSTWKQKESSFNKTNKAEVPASIESPFKNRTIHA